MQWNQVRAELTGQELRLPAGDLYGVIASVGTTAGGLVLHVARPGEELGPGFDPKAVLHVEPGVSTRIVVTSETGEAVAARVAELLGATLSGDARAGAVLAVEVPPGIGTGPLPDPSVPPPGRTEPAPPAQAPPDPDEGQARALTSR